MFYRRIIHFSLFPGVRDVTRLLCKKSQSKPEYSASRVQVLSILCVMGRVGEDDSKFTAGAWKVSHTILSVTRLFQLDLRTVVRKQRKEIVKRVVLHHHTRWSDLWWALLNIHLRAHWIAVSSAMTCSLHFEWAWQGETSWLRTLNLDEKMTVQAKNTVCQSPLMMAQSMNYCRKGEKSCVDFQWQALEISCWGCLTNSGLFACLLSSYLNPQPLLVCSKCMTVYITLT